MADLDFQVAKVSEHETGKASANPFLKAVQSLVVDGPDGLETTVASDKGINSQLDVAGKAAGVTVRRKITPNADGTFHVFFRAVTRQTRTPKDAGK